ncbi:hypothetical protein C0J52_14705 [Blattella germanica]|nr:hypothetical protein C0J52_14705 [Blattella germanica]
MELRCISFLFLICILSVIQYGIALECYVCTDQERNAEKCLNTIKTCEQGEDVCLSEIKWGSTPYWSQGAEKQYYISKRCATKDACEKTRSRYMRYCTHIWYEDWKCSECCQGDRCNYYVIVRGSILYLILVNKIYRM